MARNHIWLCRILRANLETQMPYDLPVMLQVCIALKFLDSGHFILNIGVLECLDISLSSACRVTNRVVQAIIHRTEFVQYSQGARLQAVKRGFYAIAAKCCIALACMALLDKWRNLPQLNNMSIVLCTGRTAEYSTRARS